MLDELDQLAVTGGKGEVVQLGKTDPAILLGGGEDGEERFLRAAEIQGAEEAVKNDLVAGVIVNGRRYFSFRPHGVAGLLQKLTDNRLLRLLIRFEPAAGKLPESAPDIVRQPLLDKDPAYAVRVRQDAGGHFNGHLFAAFFGDGEFGNKVIPMGEAEGWQRALGAVRVFRGADERSQLHESLIKGAGLLAGNQLFRLLPEQVPGLGQGDVDIEEAGKDAADIGVHQGHRQIVGNGGDGPGGIGADAGQGQQGLLVAGDDTAVVADDDPGAFADIDGPAVIAKALPAFEHHVLVRPGEGVDVRELPHPAVKEESDPLHLGLLQHDFRDPDLVGDIALSPGQGALVGLKPGDQGLLKGDEGKGHG